MIKNDQLVTKNRWKEWADIFRDKRSKEERRTELKNILWMLPIVAMAVTSLYLVEKTFISLWMVGIIGCIGGIIGVFVFRLLLTKYLWPVFAIRISGFFCGVAIAIFAVVGLNYFLKQKITLAPRLDILDVEMLYKRRANNRRDRPKLDDCSRFFVIVKYDNVESGLRFPCEFRKAIDQSDQVRVTMSKGLFGFYVIRDYELLSRDANSY